MGMPAAPVPCAGTVPSKQRSRSSSRSSFVSVVSISGMPAAQAPGVGTEPRNHRSRSSSCSTCRSMAPSEGVAVTGNVVAAVSGVPALSAVGDAEARDSVLSVMRALADEKSKEMRGKFHGRMRAMLADGFTPDDIRDFYVPNFVELAFNIYREELSRHCGPNFIWDAHMEEEARSLLSQRAEEDVRFFTAGPQEPAAAAVPSSEPVRVQASPGGNRAHSLRRSPGFGKGPRKTRKGK